jgi:hypothetical protein
MSELSPDARAVLDAGLDGDEPTAADEARLRRALLRSLAESMAVTNDSQSPLSARVSSMRAGAKRAAKASSERGVGLAGMVVRFIAMAAAVALGIGIDRALLRAPVVMSLGPTPPSAAGAIIDVECPACPACSSVGPYSEDAEPVSREPSVTITPSPTRSNQREPALRQSSDHGPQSTLDMETRLLREVDAALRDGQAGYALALLDGAADKLGKGKPGDARAAARAAAQCKLGSADDSARIVEQYARDYPESPLRERVRAACAPPPLPSLPPAASKPDQNMLLIDPDAEQGEAKPAPTDESGPPFGPIND